MSSALRSLRNALWEMGLGVSRLTSGALTQASVVATQALVAATRTPGAGPGASWTSPQVWERPPPASAGTLVL